jgi:outer membrane protein assembly factor BamB
MRELEPGDPQRLGDHKVLGVLGTGGFGRVFLARAPHGKWLAVKLLHPQLLRAAPDLPARFAAVMGDLTRVRNLGAGRIVQWDADDIRPWYARRHVPGAALHEVLAVCGALPQAAGRITAGVARGLAAMHDAELPHGAVAPGNVLLTATAAQLVDGGLVRLFAPGVPLLGRGLAAPGEPDGTRAADVYALGALLVLCARGRLPTGPKDVDELPERLATIATALLDPDPGSRPTAAETAAELHATRPALSSLLPSAGRRIIAEHARGPEATAQAGAEQADLAATEPGGLAHETDAADDSADPAGTSATATPEARLPRTRVGEHAATVPESAPVARRPTLPRRSAAVPSAHTVWQRHLTGVRSLYACDGRVFASGDTLAALDGRTGAVLWAKPGWRMLAEPLENRAYCAQGPRIARVDPATGAEVWRTDLTNTRGLWARGTQRLARAERAFQLNAAHHPSPDGCLVVIGGQSELFGLAPDTGAVLWKKREPRCAAFTQDGCGAIYVNAPRRGPARALDPETGEQIWRDDAEDSILYVADRGYVIGTRFTGPGGRNGVDFVWSAASRSVVLQGEFPNASTRLRDGMLYVLHKRRLRALCAADGSEVWHATWRHGLMDLAVPQAGPEAYVRDTERRVHAIDLADGSVRWTSVPVPAAAPRDTVDDVLDRTLPALADGGLVCVRSHGAQALTALDRDDGRERWRMWSRSGTLAMVEPVIADGKVYALDGDEVRALTDP